MVPFNKVGKIRNKFYRLFCGTLRFLLCVFFAVNFLPQRKRNVFRKGPQSFLWLKVEN